MNIKKYFVCDEDNLIKVISSTPFISLTKENKDITMTSFEHLKLYNKILPFPFHMSCFIIYPQLHSCQALT